MCKTLENIQVDVVIVGAGPAGFAAAVAAAREGARVLLIERENYVGGMMATGMPILSFHDSMGNKVIGGIAVELIKQLETRGASSGVILFPGHPFFPSRAFVDPELLKLVTLEMLEEAGASLLLHTLAIEPVIDNNVVRGVIIANSCGRGLIEAGVVIDASGDGVIASRAGARWFMRQKRDLQPMTLIFRMGKVDWQVFRRFILDHPDVVPSGKWVDYYREKCPKSFTVFGFQKQVESGRLEGLLPPSSELPQHQLIINMLPTGEAAINFATVGGYDPVNVSDLTAAEMKARKLVFAIATWLQKTIPGFEAAYVSYTHGTIGIRESRRIVGDYVLTESDVLNGKRFEDGVVLCGCGMDVHTPDGSPQPLKDRVSFEAFHIPLRCLLPKGLEGLIVAGRCISTTYLANGSIREMAVCMSIGQAAGTTAAHAIKNRVSPRDVDAEDLRSKLLRQGMIL